MEFYQSAEGRLGLKNMPPLVVDLLRQIPRWHDDACEAAEARLFQCPTNDPDEEGLRSDWKAHVQPELHEFFQSSRQVVESDLRALVDDDEIFSLEFPLKHAEAWLNALNQARLALAEQHGFDEAELSSSGPLSVANERDFALLQISFYAMLQQLLVEVLD